MVFTVEDYMQSKDYDLEDRNRLAATYQGLADRILNWWPEPDYTGVYPADHVDAITTQGNLLKRDGSTIRFKGVSLLSTVYENPMTLVQTLAADATLAGINVVRVPIIDTDGGNNGWDQWTNTQRVNHINNVLIPLVDYNTSQGWYTIIDRHAVKDWGDPAQLQLCKDWWTMIAPVFKGNPRVIFEMFNEPKGPYDYPDPGTLQNWLNFRAMYQPVLDLIRYYAPRNHVIIGSPVWSTRIRYAADNRFEGDNLSYCYHLYTSHPTAAQLPTSLVDWLGTQIPTTIPIFMTEFGYASGTAWDVDINNRPNYPNEVATYFAQNPQVNFTMWSYGSNVNSLSMLAANGASEKAWLSTLL